MSTCVERLERELFEADWAEAEERLGREPSVDDLARTPAQRRADAYVEMAQRAQAVPKGARLPVPLINVLVGYETFAGPLLETWSGVVLTPGQVAPWLADAMVERIVFDGPSRVVDVGSKRRFFTGALRRAIQVRDRRCFDPTCDDRPESGQIDHAKPASKGGETTQANGRLGCRFHNGHRDHDRWQDDVFPTWDDAADGPDPPDDG